LCERSILEAGTNNLTLVSVVEEVRLSPPPPPQSFIGLPLEMHMYWIFDINEMGGAFEYRLVARAEGAPEMLSQPHRVEDTLARRVRSRFVGAQIPAQSASFKFHAEWRWVGQQEWQTEGVFWPLDVTLAEPQQDAVPPP
jgi:hypothetical protein